MEEQKVVLLVEDDPTQRLSAADLLESAGYRVIEAFSHDDALRKLRHNDGVSVMITDIAMPGENNGIDLANEVHRLWPETGIIVLSGRQASALPPMPAHSTFLTKPCDARKLVALVAALD